MAIMVTMICAMTPERVIGAHGGGIPWHLPRDIEHFRACTDSKHMLLGRTTFEEMTGWFTNQTPLVLTTQRDFTPPIGVRVGSVEEAINIAELQSADGELIVSGGGRVYEAALPFADRLFLTIVETDVRGGARFPDYEVEGTWNIAAEEHFEPDDANEFAMTFVTLERSRARS